MLLKAAPLFAPTEIDAVCGSLPLRARRRRSRKWTKQSRPRRGGVRAIDTNIIVRFLTGDDPRDGKSAQAGRGGGILCRRPSAGDRMGLRSGTASQPSGSSGRFGTSPAAGVTLEDPGLAASALDWAEQGSTSPTRFPRGSPGLHGLLSFDAGWPRCGRRGGDAGSGALGNSRHPSQVLILRCFGASGDIYVGGRAETEVGFLTAVPIPCKARSAMKRFALITVEFVSAGRRATCSLFAALRLCVRFNSCRRARIEVRGLTHAKPRSR